MLGIQWGFGQGDIDSGMEYVYFAWIIWCDFVGWAGPELGWVGLGVVS